MSILPILMAFTAQAATLVDFSETEIVVDVAPGAPLPEFLEVSFASTEDRGIEVTFASDGDVFRVYHVASSDRSFDATGGWWSGCAQDACPAIDLIDGYDQPLDPVPSSVHYSNNYVNAFWNDSSSSTSSTTTPAI